jgi:DNA mismatch endonuclease (patch repair protein)
MLDMVTSRTMVNAVMLSTDDSPLVNRIWVEHEDMQSELTVSQARSADMRAIRSKDTKPELVVRRLVHAIGYRYRLHRKDLAGQPDLVFPSRRKVVFVNGCFWHGHDCRRGNVHPKTNASYWRAKIARNVERDVRSKTALCDSGWSVLTIWECETKPGNRNALVDALRTFLD